LIRPPTQPCDGSCELSAAARVNELSGPFARQAGALRRI
jgi:hypothetical protein